MKTQAHVYIYTQTHTHILYINIHKMCASDVSAIMWE